MDDKNEQIGLYLERLGVKLLPSQRKLFEKIVDEDKVYITMPPRIGYTNALYMMGILNTILKEKE